jgi:hypothetical protein
MTVITFTPATASWGDFTVSPDRSSIQFDSRLSPATPKEAKKPRRKRGALAKAPEVVAPATITPTVLRSRQFATVVVADPGGTTQSSSSSFPSPVNMGLYTHYIKSNPQSGVLVELEPPNLYTSQKLVAPADPDCFHRNVLLYERFLAWILSNYKTYKHASNLNVSVDARTGYTSVHKGLQVGNFFGWSMKKLTTIPLHRFAPQLLETVETALNGHEAGSLSEDYRGDHDSLFLINLATSLQSGESCRSLFEAEDTFWTLPFVPSHELVKIIGYILGISPQALKDHCFNGSEFKPGAKAKVEKAIGQALNVNPGFLVSFYDQQKIQGRAITRPLPLPPWRAIWVPPNASSDSQSIFRNWEAEAHGIKVSSKLRPSLEPFTSI